jgi:hypothetical protein
VLKFVVEQHELGRLLRDVRPDRAHRNADVGLLWRQCVVHAVTGDGNDLGARGA